MKRSNQLRKPGNNIPCPKGQRKNKNRFHELKQQFARNNPDPSDDADFGKNTVIEEEQS